MRWTVPRLTDACWRALKSGKVRVRFGPLPDASAVLETEPGYKDRAIITADRFQAGDLENVVHELLHYVVENEWPRIFGREVEEVIVLALEDAVVRYVNRTQQRKWRAALAKPKRVVRRRLSE